MTTKPDEAFGVLLATKKVLLMNDPTKDRAFINPLKAKLGVKIQNAMLVPLIDSSGEVAMAMLLVNRFSMVKDAKNSKQIIKFTGSPWTNPILHAEIMILQKLYDAKSQLLLLKSLETNLIDIVDEILGEKSLFAFQKRLEEELASFLDVERVTVILCQRFDKYMYRIRKDASGDFSIQKFNLDSGIAGYVVQSKQVVL